MRASAKEQVYQATGKRKTAVVRIFLSKGEGKITVNDRSFENYFPQGTDQLVAREALRAVEMDNQFDVRAVAAGGGPTGQAQALRHGIARALCAYNPELRGPLKKGGFLTRDSRRKERKKYGQKGARKRFQYSKR
jgi:small subunit ribosomal protein S9